MTTTLAGPPSACCFNGFKHTGTSEGRVESIGGLNTYIAEPSTASGPHVKVLFFLSDIFGSLSINNKLLQDYFASCGFVVLGPDYLFGQYVQDVPGDVDKFAWAHTRLDAAVEAFPKWLDAVKAKYGTETTKYTAAGYCFGAPFVMDLIADGFVEAGAVIHPVFLDEKHFEKAIRPILLSCSEVDVSFPLEARRRAEDILVRNKSSYHIQVFSGVEHGFATRGNPDVPDQRWAKEESARGIKDWFLRFSA
ncbi:dienelactone hydrolase [Chiua virens]|nr:dienelactone hydrolase [Chiua virens]